MWRIRIFPLIAFACVSLLLSQGVIANDRANCEVAPVSWTGEHWCSRSSRNGGNFSFLSRAVCRDWRLSLPDFYSGATEQISRFNEGLLLRRLQACSIPNIRTLKLVRAKCGGPKPHRPLLSRGCCYWRRSKHL